MRPLRYILNGHEPVPCDDLSTWGRWMDWAENHEALEACRVGATHVGDHFWISTMFLGKDVCVSGDGPPLLFESMVFRDGDGCELWRYATWEDAEAGHAAVVAWLSGQGPRPE